MTIPALCDDCVALVAWVTSNPPEDAIHKISKSGPFWLPSMQKCPMCVRLGHFLPLECSSVTECNISLQRDIFGKIAALDLEFRRDPEMWLNYKVYIWADEDSRASRDCDISTLVCADPEDGPETIAIIKRWLDRCANGVIKPGQDGEPHDLCRWSMARTMIDESSELIPSDRILDVGAIDSDSVQLIETAGIKGKYCALSHCWGPPDKRPPPWAYTTLENEKAHFEGIKLEVLPKTFKDAIMVTRGLGLRYLWIDSLCIRQNDNQHWQQESAQMGAIYSLAYLRIAAAGASHCDNGLFGNRTCTPLQIIFNSEVDDQGEIVAHHVFHVQVSGGPDVEPQRSLLSTRAWCFQEARLSRRTVSFMRPGICWDCRDITYPVFDERDCNRSLRVVNWTNWESNIEEYSCGYLTFESDRLLALEGLANEFSKRWRDSHHLGVLRDGLPRQLLWRTTTLESGMTGLPDLPSWTWAAWPGQKQFLYKRYPIPDDNAGVVAHFLGFHQDGRSLTLQGSLVPCTVSSVAAEIGDIGFEATAENFRKWSLEEIEHTYSYDSLYPRYSPEFYLTNKRQSDVPARLLWTNIGGENQPVGMVQLDREVGDSALFYCCLIIARRLPNDPLRKLFDGSVNETGGTEVASEMPDWTVVKQYGKSRLFYCVVVLQSTDSESSFRRVGSGIVWPTSWIADRPANQTFHLI